MPILPSIDETVDQTNSQSHKPIVVDDPLEP